MCVYINSYCIRSVSHRPCWVEYKDERYIQSKRTLAQTADWFLHGVEEVALGLNIVPGTQMQICLYLVQRECPLYIVTDSHGGLVLCIWNDASKLLPCLEKYSMRRGKWWNWSVVDFYQGEISEILIYLQNCILPFNNKDCKVAGQLPVGWWHYTCNSVVHSDFKFFWKMTFKYCRHILAYLKMPVFVLLQVLLQSTIFMWWNDCGSVNNQKKGTEQTWDKVHALWMSLRTGSLDFLKKQNKNYNSTIVRVNYEDNASSFVTI